MKVQAGEFVVNDNTGLTEAQQKVLMRIRDECFLKLETANSLLMKLPYVEAIHQIQAMLNTAPDILGLLRMAMPGGMGE